MAVKDLIEIEAQNVVFAKVPFDAPGQNDLAQFAVQGALAIEKKRARHLLRDGTGAFAHAPSPEIHPCRTQDPPHISAMM
jgi:hypothetical protein